MELWHSRVGKPNDCHTGLLEAEERDCEQDSGDDRASLK
jgi:hypothetical protein